MKRYIYAIIFIFSIPISLSAQNFSAGPIVGFNYNSIYFNENFTLDGKNYQFRTDDGGLGVNGGAFARIDYKKFFGEASFIFSQEKSTAVFHTNRDSRIQDINLNRIYLPVKLGYTVDSKFDVFLGANMSHFVDGSMMPSHSSLYVTYDNNTNPLSLGYFMGLGIKVDRFNINLNYNGNLGATRVATSFQGQPLDFQQTDHNFTFTLSYDLVIKNLVKEEDTYFNPKELMVTD